MGTVRFAFFVGCLVLPVMMGLFTAFPQCRSAMSPTHCMGRAIADFQTTITARADRLAATLKRIEP